MHDDFCVGDPISCLLTVGSRPVWHSVLNVKCEGANRCFQPGEGPSDYKPSDEPSFQALPDTQEMCRGSAEGWR